MLTGGHHNSLGRTQEVVDSVLADRTRLGELFATITSEDALVRMRAGDALEKLCREQHAWFLPYVSRILTELGSIDQPSVQWHVAQMLQHLHGDLSARQAHEAIALLQRNLSGSSDWIVLNVTMDVLAGWAGQDTSLKRWLKPELQRLGRDDRKSVAKRAQKRLADLAN